MAARKTRITRADRQTFLTGLEQALTIVEAAALTPHHIRSFYRHRDNDPDFAAAWAEAYEVGNDVFRAESRRRAVEGVEEPIFQGGGQVGTRRVFSDTLLLAELKRRDHSYRENTKLELTGAAGGPVEIQAGYTPTTLADVVRLAGELGVLEQLGYTQLPPEDAPLELEAGGTDG